MVPSQSSLLRIVFCDKYINNDISDNIEKVKPIKLSPKKLIQEKLIQEKLIQENLIQEDNMKRKISIDNFMKYSWAWTM